MSKLKSSHLVFLGFIGLACVSASVFLLAKRLGDRYNQSRNSEVIIKNSESNQFQSDIKRIHYQGDDGSTLEILQNGTIVKIDETGNKKQSVLGFSRLRGLYSALTEVEIIALQNQNQDQTGAKLTIETKSGNTYVIIISDNHQPSPKLDDFIDEIIDTEDNTFNPPTPIPTPIIFQTPTPTPISSPTPSPYVQVDFSTPIPTNNFPSPSPTSLPDYITAQPFNCHDYHLSKKTIISNIICEPSP